MVLKYSELQSAFKKYLSGINLLKLVSQISEFKMLNFNEISEMEISSRISNILNVKQDKLQHTPVLRDFLHYRKGTLFYRVRDLDFKEKEKFSIPLKTIKIESDIWNRPAKDCIIQRLNSTGESLLYTTPEDKLIAIKEKKIQDNENFILIIYESVIDIAVSDIGLKPKIVGLSIEEQIKFPLINDFLTDVFIRDVGAGTEYLYKISNVISKRYFNIPLDYSAGYAYPSIADKSKINVCFFEQNIKTKLKFKYFLVCTKQEIIKYKYVSIFKNEKFLYYKIGSPEQKRLFPELSEI